MTSQLTSTRTAKPNMLKSVSRLPNMSYLHEIEIKAGDCPSNWRAFWFLEHLLQLFNANTHSEHTGTERSHEMAEAEIKTLNSLLKGELSARETYQQAIEKFESADAQAARQAEKLHSIKEDHENAVQKLSAYVRDCGGEPAESSGVWGSWASMVHGSAQVLGHGPALTVLKKGEEIGLAQYEKALSRGELTPGAQNHIRDLLLPQQYRHIQTLRVLTDSV
jgi:hypothetical protein